MTPFLTFYETVKFHFYYLLMSPRSRPDGIRLQAVSRDSAAFEVQDLNRFGIKG
jgi:hypothetical protein